MALCPECAHILYGYPNCGHVFKNGRCIYCYWDGSRSKYIEWLLSDDWTKTPGYWQNSAILYIKKPDQLRLQYVCGRIRTFGALPHTTLAGWHHRPLGHANGKWMGQDSNLRCFFVTDLQSAALATRHTHPWGDQGESVSAPLRSAQSRCPPDILRPREPVSYTHLTLPTNSLV